jgi:DNA (cytosine-5)-methyltransferase 1
MLRAISLYTGVGGLDFGLEAAGIRTAAAVEMDSACCRTLRLNRKWPVIEDDIHDVSSERILAEAKLERGEADLLVGGPPCQPFSKSSYWVTGDSLRLDDPRSDTLSAYLRVLRDTQPKAFLLENVYGLAYKGKSEGLDLLVRGIREINKKTKSNYSVSCSVLNTADYGVPQTRERVFLVGSRDGATFNFPPATHIAPEERRLLDTGLEPHRTAWDALADVFPNLGEPGLEVGGRWGALLPSIPEGQNYLWHTPRGGGKSLFGWRTRYWSFLLKLAKNRPSWTIQAQPGPYIGPFHWTNRRLTTHEMCRLQTFPDGLKFESSRNEVQRMLGNAVPSLMAEILAREIRKQLLKAPARGALKLLPPRRHQIPDPEPVQRVPKDYLSLIGNHPEHPGTGKGRAALQRKRLQGELGATQLF